MTRIHSFVHLFIEELEKDGKVSLGRYEFRMVRRDDIWYGAVFHQKIQMMKLLALPTRLAERFI